MVEFEPWTTPSTRWHVWRALLPTPSDENSCVLYDGLRLMLARCTGSSRADGSWGERPETLASGP